MSAFPSIIGNRCAKRLTYFLSRVCPVLSVLDGPFAHFPQWSLPSQWALGQCDGNRRKVLVMPQKNELPPVTPGVRTSEFILALVIVALCVAGVASAAKVPSGYSALLVALIGTAYPVLRNGLKQRHLELASELLSVALENQSRSRPIAEAVAQKRCSQSSGPVIN